MYSKCSGLKELNDTNIPKAVKYKASGIWINSIIQAIILLSPWSAYVNLVNIISAGILASEYPTFCICQSCCGKPEMSLWVVNQWWTKTLLADGNSWRSASRDSKRALLGSMTKSSDLFALIRHNLVVNIPYICLLRFCKCFWNTQSITCYKSIDNCFVVCPLLQLHSTSTHGIFLSQTIMFFTLAILDVAQSKISALLPFSKKILVQFQITDNMSVCSTACPS